MAEQETSIDVEASWADPEGLRSVPGECLYLEYAYPCMCLVPKETACPQHRAAVLDAHLLICPHSYLRTNVPPNYSIGLLLLLPLVPYFGIDPCLLNDAG